MDTNKLIPLLAEMAVFVTVVEEGSFANAAVKLGVAPSSVSRSLRRLETALKEQLLERTTRQMRLTATGQEVFHLCQTMLGQAKLAVSAAHANKEAIAGPLRVAVPKALAKQVLMSPILTFAKQYPNVNLTLKVEDRYLDPIHDDVDVVIHITPNPVEGLVAVTLAPCQLVLCASPVYLAKHGTPAHPNDLRHHQCLCLGESPKDRIWRMTQGTQTVAAPVSGHLAVNHSEIRRQAVLEGLGISLFPEFVVRNECQQGVLQPILSEWQLAGSYQGQIVAQYPQSPFIPSQVKAFVAHLKSALTHYSAN